jgi:hypothetical protein
MTKYVETPQKEKQYAIHVVLNSCNSYTKMNNCSNCNWLSTKNDLEKHDYEKLNNYILLLYIFCQLPPALKCSTNQFKIFFGGSVLRTHLDLSTNPDLRQYILKILS